MVQLAPNPGERMKGSRKGGTVNLGCRMGHTWGENASTEELPLADRPVAFSSLLTSMASLPSPHPDSHRVLDLGSSVHGGLWQGSVSPTNSFLLQAAFPRCLITTTEKPFEDKWPHVNGELGNSKELREVIGFHLCFSGFPKIGSVCKTRLMR